MGENKTRNIGVAEASEVYCTPQASGQPLVEIVGRPAGVIAFVLTVLQLQPQTKLIATDSGIEYEMASLFGQIQKFIPMSRVASMSAGLHKPVGYLIVAGLLFLIGAMISVQIGSSIPIVVALVFQRTFLVGYFISKSVLFEMIKSNAGIEISLCFRPGVIEGMPVDSDVALAAAGVIRDLILERPICGRSDSMPIGIGSQLGNRFVPSVSPAQAARHSPPPFFDNVASVINGFPNNDGAHEEETKASSIA